MVAAFKGMPTPGGWRCYAALLVPGVRAALAAAMELEEYWRLCDVVGCDRGVEIYLEEVERAKYVPWAVNPIQKARERVSRGDWEVDK